MRRLLTIPVMTLLSTLAIGQEVLVEEEPEIRRYTVEVIIFSYAEDVSVGTELFLPDLPVVEEFAPEPDETFVFGDTTTELDPEPEVVDAEAEKEPRGREFVLNIEDEFSMLDIESRLERLDAYEPLMHFSWTQTTHAQEDTTPIELAALGESPEGLSGSFTLYLSRYLHLVVDLTLDDPPPPEEPVAIDNSVFTFSDERSGLGYDASAPGPVRFRIQENRIFKNGDLRYFDHPKFGVLARITRVEEEEEEVEPEMLGDDPRELLGVDQ